MRDENKISLSSSLFVAKTTLVTSKRLNYTMMLITSMIQSFVRLYYFQKVIIFFFASNSNPRPLKSFILLVSPPSSNKCNRYILESTLQKLIKRSYCYTTNTHLLPASQYIAWNLSYLSLYGIYFCL